MERKKLPPTSAWRAIPIRVRGNDIIAYGVVKGYGEHSFYDQDSTFFLHTAAGQGLPEIQANAEEAARRLNAGGSSKKATTR